MIFHTCGAWLIDEGNCCKAEPVVWYAHPNTFKDAGSDVSLIGLCEDHIGIEKLGVLSGLIPLTDEEASVFLVMEE